MFQRERHFIASMLYGVPALDSATYCGVISLILLVAGSASLMPALRASRVEPVQVLREASCQSSVPSWRS